MSAWAAWAVCAWSIGGYGSASGGDRPLRPDLAKELIAMGKRDQSVRNELLAAKSPQLQRAVFQRMNRYDAAKVRDIVDMDKEDQVRRFRWIENEKPELANTLLGRLNLVQYANTSRLKAIVELCGWPTPDRVGWRASDRAFSIVYHSISELPFRMRCMNLMVDGLDSGLFRRADVGRLVDRMLVAQGRLQRFGSQWRFKNHDIVLEPIAEPEKVEARRRRMGMNSMAEDEKALRKTYRNMLNPHSRRFGTTESWDTKTSR